MSEEQLKFTHPSLWSYLQCDRIERTEEAIAGSPKKIIFNYISTRSIHTLNNLTQDAVDRFFLKATPSNCMQPDIILKY